jgi:hypothetical protein
METIKSDLVEAFWILNGRVPAAADRRACKYRSEHTGEAVAYDDDEEN